MTEAFWRLIESAREKSGGDLDEMYEALFNSLLDLSVQELMLWARILRQYYCYASSDDIYSISRRIFGNPESQEFRGFCGWLIAQGSDAYFSALYDAKAASVAVVAENKELEFSELEMLPAHVYMQKKHLAVFNYEAYWKEYQKYQLPMESIKQILRQGNVPQKTSGWQMIGDAVESRHLAYS